jgi:nicotinate-nucleotide--dimethylbenzimidazole phosphoribosyltransferase
MLSLLGALVLAGGAMTQTAGAAGTSGDQVATEPSTSPEASEGTPPPDPGAEAAEGVPGGPGPQESPEVVRAPPAEEPPEGVPAGPPAEEPPEVVPVVPAAEDSPEVVASGASTEAAAEGSLSPLPVNSQDSVARNEPVEGAAPGPPAALIDSLETPSTVAGPAEARASLHASVAPVGAVAEMIAAQRPQDLSCELSAVGGRMTDSCSTGSSATEHFMSASHSGLATAVTSLAAATGGLPPDGGHGGSAVGNPPVGPTPGPAPGGASGSAAGASGLALSGFLTLAGLLLLGAPRAMRMLRLSCQPWRTACFALIPERPG